MRLMEDLQSYLSKHPLLIIASAALSHAVTYVETLDPIVRFVTTMVLCLVAVLGAIVKFFDFLDWARKRFIKKDEEANSETKV
jgi:hypothetical protein